MREPINRVVVLSGAGISAESGLQTFRGADGLLVVGTSLQVYPAAGLVFEAPKKARRIVVNPDVLDKASGPGFEVVAISSRRSWHVWSGLISLTMSPWRSLVS